MTDTHYGRFLSNTYNPTRQDAQEKFPFSDTAHRSRKVMEEEWRTHMNWVNEHMIGRPQATEHRTVEQLEAMGMIGVYAHPTNQPDYYIGPTTQPD